jgi:hypothetical protein
MDFKNSERGSALVEHCAVLSVLIPAFVGLMILLYLGFAKVWLSHSSDEAAICLSTDEDASTCENELRFKVQNILKFGALKNLQITKTANEIHIEADFEFKIFEGVGQDNKNIDLHAEASLALPVQPRQQPKLSSLSRLDDPAPLPSDLEENLKNF